MQIEYVGGFLFSGACIQMKSQYLQFNNISVKHWFPSI